MKSLYEFALSQVLLKVSHVTRKINSFRLLGLPKVLPDLNPSACIAETAGRQRDVPGDRSSDMDSSDSSRIPSPIIEVRTDYDYGPAFSSALSSPTSSLQRPQPPPGVQVVPGNYAVPRNINRPPMFASEPQQYTYQQHQPLYSGAVYPIYRHVVLLTNNTLPSSGLVAVHVFLVHLKSTLI